MRRALLIKEMLTSLHDVSKVFGRVEVCLWQQPKCKYGNVHRLDRNACMQDRKVVRSIVTACITIAFVSAIIWSTSSNAASPADELLETSFLGLRMQVPPGAKAGDMLSVQIPGHRLREVEVPAGAKTGDLLAIKAPDGSHHRALERVGRMKVIVSVPATAIPGDMLEVAVPGHGSHDVAVPAGVRPGQVFSFDVATPAASRPVSLPSALVTAMRKTMEGRKTSLGSTQAIQQILTELAFTTKMNKITSQFSNHLGHFVTHLPAAAASSSSPPVRILADKQAAGEAQGNATSGSEDEYAPLIEGVTCTAPVLFCLVLAFCTTLSLL